MNRIYRICLLLVMGGLVPCAESHAVSLPQLFSDNMVLQRDQAITIWGWAEPNEEVTIRLAGQMTSLTAGADGTWKTSLPPMSAGGPYQLEVEGHNTLVYENVLIGEVWLCSGQSNMGWPVNQSMHAQREIQHARYPAIRLFSAPHEMKTHPEDDFEKAMGWKECNPQTVPDFSAVAYFFGRDIHLAMDSVPVGLIDASWGGSEVEAWTSHQSLSKMEQFKEEITMMKTLDLEAEQKKRTEKIEHWAASMKKLDKGISDGEYRWASDEIDILKWKGIYLPSLLKNTPLKGFQGGIWFKRYINFTPEDAGLDYTLVLGRIADSDITFINGEKIGENFNRSWMVRAYPVPSGLLKRGRNYITIRMESYDESGGFSGRSDQFQLESEEKTFTLSGTWYYKIGFDSVPEYPGNVLRPNNLAGSLFNGMISPILPYTIRGAIWYQGEANANRGYEYRELFPLMIKDWRNHWGQGDFPFLYVQLANFMEPVSRPVESNWAELREAQLLTRQHVPNTGMAVIMDIGEADDIHPRNKQDVGYRLSLLARGKVYGEDIVYTGPLYDTLKIEGNKIRISFLHTGSGLAIRNGEKTLKGFAIAGKDKKFKWAKAAIDGDEVVVYHDSIDHPVAVRYGWANNPADANLYNKEGLPASPFRTDYRIKELTP